MSPALPGRNYLPGSPVSVACERHHGQFPRPLQLASSCRRPAVSSPEPLVFTGLEASIALVLQCAVRCIGNGFSLCGRSSSFGALSFPGGRCWSSRWCGRLIHGDELAQSGKRFACPWVVRCDEDSECGTADDPGDVGIGRAVHLLVCAARLIAALDHWLHIGHGLNICGDHSILGWPGRCYRLSLPR